MKEDVLIGAENMLLNMLKAQPNLLKEVYPSKDSGKELADFAESFIRQYSAHREIFLK